MTGVEAVRKALAVLIEYELSRNGGKDKDGRSVTFDLSTVPARRGSVFVYNGYDIRGGGVSHDMHHLAKSLGWSSDLTLVYRWKLDEDGSVYNWLEHQKDKPCPEAPPA